MVKCFKSAGQIQQLNAQPSQLPSELTQQLAMLSAEKTRIQQQLTETNARGEILISAPISGQVTNLFAEAGTTMNGQLPLATIVSNNGTLNAILLVPTQAFGFVEAGQQARIRFDAFPHQ
ncbi:efflux RND transporter periplasmic adaptor subunit [Alteromonas sp. S015]|uniref:efflux RND transporter periplasmic adaptor subunit n=1 Tax=Alteromonas sp. S015 TaxID=3117401 RepID=UPI002FE12E47